MIRSILFLCLYGLTTVQAFDDPVLARSASLGPHTIRSPFISQLRATSSQPFGVRPHLHRRARLPTGPPSEHDYSPEHRTAHAEVIQQHWRQHVQRTDWPQRFRLTPEQWHGHVTRQLALMHPDERIRAARFAHIAHHTGVVPADYPEARAIHRTVKRAAIAALRRSHPDTWERGVRGHREAVRQLHASARREAQEWAERDMRDAEEE